MNKRNIKKTSKEKVIALLILASLSTTIYAEEPATIKENSNVTNLLTADVNALDKIISKKILNTSKETFKKYAEEKAKELKEHQDKFTGNYIKYLDDMSAIVGTNKKYTEEDFKFNRNSRIFENSDFTMQSYTNYEEYKSNVQSLIKEEIEKFSNDKGINSVNDGENYRRGIYYLGMDYNKESIFYDEKEDKYYCIKNFGSYDETRKEYADEYGSEELSAERKEIIENIKKVPQELRSKIGEIYGNFVTYDNNESEKVAKETDEIYDRRNESLSLLKLYEEFDSEYIEELNKLIDEDNIIAGNNSTSKSKNTILIGNNIQVGEDFDGAIVIGNDSQAAKSKVIEKITLNGKDFDFAGKAPESAVSFGSNGKERQLKNVAAGEISENSTDAVNGSQLNAIINMPVNFYNSTNKSSESYSSATEHLTSKISEMNMEFGYGLKAEKVKDKDKNIILVALDKNALKNDNDFKGDKGDAGKDGKSAYEIWKEKDGNSGKTEDEFLATLKGDKGDTGAAGKDGKSAYEIWKEKDGNADKTEDEFLTTIKGKDGIEIALEKGNNIDIKKEEGKYIISTDSDLKNISSVSNGTTEIILNKTEKSIDVKGAKLTNLELGEISAVSRDAVVGAQLNETNDRVTVLEAKEASNNKKIEENSSNINKLDQSVKRVGSLGAAIAGLHPLQYDKKKPSQVMAALGQFSGSSAVAVGVGHYVNENLLLTTGLAISQGSQTKTMGNIGFTWKFGKDENSEELPERYEEGPISSIYLLQEEVEELRVQNKQFMIENKELKLEIEKIKEQLKVLLSR